MFFYIFAEKFKKSFMIKIVKYSFPDLWNSEYPIVVNHLINIIERHNPYELYLGLAFDRLAEFRIDLAKITVQERSEQETEMLNELNVQRDKLFNVINSVARSFQRAPVEDMSSHAKRILAVFKKHGKDIPDSNYTAKTKRLFDMVADIKSQPEIMASLEALSLLIIFERLSEVNSEFESLFMERKYKRAENHIDIRSIRKECDKTITFFWKALEYCIKAHGEENYISLVNTINTLNSYHKQRLASRSTRRKAK